jgi:uncharacterized membrane protein YfcA
VVNWRLDLSLSAASFAGAWFGAVLARWVSNLWLRRVFIGAVVVMALKTLAFDLPRGKPVVRLAATGRF